METQATPLYVIVLRDEFVRRKSKNSAYSLTAFAKHLGVDQSMFSKILSGKKKISEQLASQLLLKAGVAPEKINLAISPEPQFLGVFAKTGAAANFQWIEEDEFNFLSDWMPFAVLELAKTKGFKSDAKWIARRLGAHAEEVTAAIERLKRFGYISQNEKGKLKLEKPNNEWTNSKQTSQARKQLQKKFAELSAKAIDDVPFELREHGSLTIAINKKRLPELKERLRQFRMELGKLMQEDTTLDEVYQITLTAFPLTKLGEK